MTAKKFSLKELEGNCIGLVDGKVVIKSKSIKKVMNALIKDYPNREIAITSMPKGDKVFIL